MFTDASPRYPVSQAIKDRLLFTNASSQEAKIVANFCEKQALHYLTLEYDPDTDWERLPTGIREILVKRCTGQGHPPVTKAQEDWISFDKAHGLSTKTFIERCNFGAFVAISNRNYALGSRADSQTWNHYHESTLDSLKFLRVRRPEPRFTSQKLLRGVKLPFGVVYHNIGMCIRLIATAFVAEPELQRELDYALNSAPAIIRSIVLFIITSVWRYTKCFQDATMWLFVLYKRRNVSDLWKHIGGTTISLVKHDRVSIQSADGSSTAFIHSHYGAAGTFTVCRLLQTFCV